LKTFEKKWKNKLDIVVSVK